MGELRLHVVVEDGESLYLEALEVLVQRVHEDGEGQVAFELRRRSREDELPAQLGARAELSEQPGLADPRLPNQLDRGRAASSELVEGVLKRTEILGAPHEQVRKHGHARLLRPRWERLASRRASHR